MMIFYIVQMKQVNNVYVWMGVCLLCMFLLKLMNFKKKYMEINKLKKNICLCLNKNMLFF